VCVCAHFWLSTLSNLSWNNGHTHLVALCPGLPRWAGIRKVKPIWILLKQETVSGSGISWTICKCAPHCTQITPPAPHHSVFYRPDALPAAQPTVLKHWRHKIYHETNWNDFGLTCSKNQWLVLSQCVPTTFIPVSRLSNVKGNFYA